MGVPVTDFEIRSRSFSFSFKNGRGNPPNHRTFADVVARIVREAAPCPAFQERSVLVPIPRSGSSRESFDRDAVIWPTEPLAHAIAKSSGHRVAHLIHRHRPVPRSSDGPQGRVSVMEHLASMRVSVEPALFEEPIVLLDDQLTKGTQSMACLRALRRAGYLGPIQAYFVHQTVAPRPNQEQRDPFLCHRITWVQGAPLAQRVEIGRWWDGPCSFG
jgi:hypothetical protein